ncbi:MAG: 2-phospho-L-lactate guanylyltransferase [Proteobacteria bacterium]|nr:2-phospho-L-lactate guanylyltransferase [Pseudomonadota bacterium]
MSSWAVIAVKARAAGKQRLAAVLDPAARIHLVRDMLGHVLGVVSECPQISDVAVLTPERDLLPQAVQLLADPGTGLNAALAAGLRDLQQRGARQVTIVAADLPQLTLDEVSELVRAAAAEAVAIAPDARGRGTNALSLYLPSRFSPQFGHDSLKRHLQQARRAGLGGVLVQRAGLAFDVDEPVDLEDLARRSSAYHQGVHQGSP